MEPADAGAPKTCRLLAFGLPPERVGTGASGLRIRKTSASETSGRAGTGKLFNRRVNREIFDKIFPHLNQEANNGYPFHSDDQLVQSHIRGGLDAMLNLEAIEMTAAKLPAAYGKAFRHIAYRDLNERMKMYLEIAEERLQPERCDPRFVATAAA